LIVLEGTFRITKAVLDGYIKYAFMRVCDQGKTKETDRLATGRGNEVMAPSYGLPDLTVYGRQEFWEDSPEGPQHWGSRGDQMRLDGRPTAQCHGSGRTQRRPRHGAW